MDWDDFDENLDDLIEWEAMPERERISAPSYRATIRKGKIWIRGWHPNLFSRGQRWPGRKDAEVGIADLSVVKTGESRDLVVQFVRTSPSGGDEEVLRDWAAQTGYSRIWFADGPVDLKIDPQRLGPARTTCPVCRTRWSTEGDPQFWAGVLKAGFFPDTCTVCGCNLPEWRS